MKRIAPSQEMKAAREALITAMQPHADLLGGENMMAVLAYTLGQIVALQDQRKLSPDRCMAIISGNIEQGNQDAIAQWLGSPEGRA